jgi:hypothetical protein
MNKVVINDCFGGFSLSKKARNWLESMTSLCPEELWDTERESEFKYTMVSEMPRHHPMLVACVEEFGSAADGDCAMLKVMDIPGNRYIITEYDGNEWVTTPQNIQWTEVPEKRIYAQRLKTGWVEAERNFE